MTTVTKKFEFESAHHLPGYMGKCAELHGHTFKLEVEISKAPTGSAVYNGMVLDFNDIKSIVTERIIEKLDHKCLNDLFSFNPTSENLVAWIADELLNCFGAGLESVRLYETSNSYATWRKSYL